MRKSNKFLIITLLFFCSSWAKEKRAEISDINSFLKNLNEISLPFSTKSLPRAQKVSNDFFYYEKGNNYYELDDLKCFGYFKKEEVIYLLYGFNLIGEGEGYADNMIVLSYFDETGKHIEDVQLGGSSGGEGGAYIYEKAVVTEKDIVIDLRDEHYDSDTGLPYSIIEYKRDVYNYTNNKYNLIKKTYRCDKLKNLQEYYLKLKKGVESKDHSIYGLSYLLDNYMHCFPITENNITKYKHIWNYIKKSVDNKSVDLLAKQIKEIDKTANLYMVSVNNLRLRDEAGLKANKIELLPMNNEVIYLGEKSKYEQEVIINDRKIIDYWYKVKTTKGNIGWLHGCCVNSL